MKAIQESLQNTIRDYIFIEFTNSLCPHCLQVVPAKVILKDHRIYLLEYCPEHGEQSSLLEESADYHMRKRKYDKPGTPMQVHTKVEKGCPFDCGICPQHDQHACIGLIEITNRCNLHCPFCYADAGDGEFLPLEIIEQMMDFFQESEGGQAEILQISGGEPTLHPDIHKILHLAKSKNFKYVMLNTNGIRIAEDDEFVQTLSQFVGGFEIYLQFDGLKESSYIGMRGQNLLDKKRTAIDKLSSCKIPTTLVATIAPGINDQEVGSLFLFALSQACVRGINYQPLAFFGRTASTPGEDRITLSGILRRLEDQSSGMLRMDDFIPLPCNVERIAMTYLYRTSKGGFTPLTRDTRIQDYLHLINNTFVFTIEDALKSAGGSVQDITTSCECLKFLQDFRHIVPFNFFSKNKEQKMEYIDQNTFRISVSSFLDAYNFDTKSMQKECVHVITPDLKKIPFSAYNTIHRGCSHENHF
ncbi:MAG TPA: radical SAM protein [Syntrophomonadaceae bacterium]|nr:radical SAM protein [Syntrophomonadaceae bacterium]